MQSITERREVTNDRLKTKIINSLCPNPNKLFGAGCIFWHHSTWAAGEAMLSGGRLRGPDAWLHKKCIRLFFYKKLATSVYFLEHSAAAWWLIQIKLPAFHEKHPIWVHNKFILFSSVVFLCAALIKSLQKEELGFEYLHFLVVSPSPPHTSPALHFHVV